MKIALVFIFGFLVGITSVNLAVINSSDKEKKLIKMAEVAYTSNSIKSIQSIQNNSDKPLMRDGNNHKSAAHNKLDDNNFSTAKSLIKTFKADTDLLNSEQFLDLSYLARKDIRIANLIKQTILASDLNEDKSALLKVLSSINKPETLNFGIEMLKDPDLENKKLAIKLLSSIPMSKGTPQISHALITASYHESSPELISAVITQFEHYEFDQETKNEIAERLQYFTESENSLIQAKAIDGLVQIADPYTIQDTIKEFIYDSNERVKISAISAVFHLELSLLDDEIISILTQIIEDPNTSQSTRNIAVAALDVHRE